MSQLETTHLGMTQADTAGPDVGLRRARLAWRPGIWQAAWILFALIALASFLPLRFSATTTLAFEVGTQPPAGAMRGVAQMLGSRELAYDAVRQLPDEDVRRIAASGLTGWLSITRAGTEGRSDSVAAAWRLMENLEVAPTQSGRALRLTVSAATPGLAVRVADAYVSAFLSLDRATREGQDEPSMLPTPRRGEAGRASFVPEPPGPLALGLLAAAAALLMIARRTVNRPAEAEGVVDGAVLPVELNDSHRITWIGGPEGAGLDADAAVDRLVAHLASPCGKARLILLTSDDLPEASAACAVSLARRLSEDAGVALVALDGSAESLAALVSDPWAPGMSELLFGVAGFGETIHRDARSRAHVIPPGRDVLSGSAVVGAERLALVLEALKRTYDYVVVAAPSLSAARGGRRIAGLDPLVVCLNADDAPPTAAVETFDALADKKFGRVVMLCLASGRAEEEAPESEDHLAVPSLEPQKIDPPPLPERLAGAA
ncbi:hypothetical protein LJE71_22250 [Xanthobacter autotrophicus]|uniref:hypothetical protein n=1 Tax=Xanthobacter autotrophicus TaxID=280 RepID=UPI001E5C8B58|nr:hypothetical protein [Xanthobacter autotrophicus]UDQ88906.1 hypothetical protein LJE71_22250 [Xanthobacter autotrophicus]